MKPIFTLLCCVMLIPAFSDTIRNIEFHLPKAAQEWEIGNTLQSEKETTLIYVPKGTKKHDAKEFFGANANTLPSEVTDISSLKVELVKMYPDMDVDLQLLEKVKDGVLYEWTAKKNGQEKVHGWVRVFPARDSTVLLGYQTENISDVVKARSTWLPVLKEAKTKR